MNVRAIASLVGVAAAAAVLVACGTKGTSTSADRPEESPAAKPQVLKVQNVDGFSPLVTNAKGRTVYRFDKDSANPPKSTCVDACAEAWPPVLALAGVQVEGGGIEEDDLGTIDRAEGKQVTLKGQPLYYFKDDLELGQTAGHGMNNTWFAVSPEGGKAKRTGQSGGGAPAQDGQQVLTVNTVDGFSPLVTNAKGRTIYRFEKDSARPSKSTCFDACAQNWPPVLAGPNGFRVEGDGIDPSDVGTIDRPEGKQLTLKGRPLYYYKTDLKLGQTAGHGVGGVWFAIAPDGAKATKSGSGGGGYS